jgi:transcription initiation factor IIE alpha subunit
MLQEFDRTDCAKILRLLRNNGIFTYKPERDSYANNCRSELLRSDH